MSDDDEAEPSLGEAWLKDLAHVPSREPPAPSLALGSVVGHYRVLSRVGAGGMGVVYEAMDENLRRVVALKVLPPVYAAEERLRARFLVEARSLAAITHPNVATVHEVAEADGRIYIAMELVEGRTLRALLRAESVAPITAARLGLAIASGLASAHQKGIIHRDLKPENVMLTPGDEVKLLDFGLAKLLVDTPGGEGLATGEASDATDLSAPVAKLTQHGQIIGTRGYMAPEQARGEAVDARCDVYALGVVLYELIAGERPHDERPAPLPDVWPELQAVVDRALAHAPEARYPSASEVAVALAGAVAAWPGDRPSAGPAPARALVAPRERVGTVLGRKYRIDAVLGAGAMATVYAATHRTGHRVALKMLHPQHARREDVRSRFLQEAYAANRIEHPGVVRITDDDVDAEDGTPFLVMELLEGETLEAWSARVGIAPTLEVASAVHQVLDVLVEAHARGIVHRDLKPENLFRTRDHRIKVMDFGIARALYDSSARSRTKTGTLLGTPAFMPPEQARGRTAEIDGRTDLWALAATAYRLLSGRLVHEEETLAMLHVASATRPAGSLGAVAPHVPRELVEVFDRALQFDRAARWPTAEAMMSALEDAVLRAYGERLTRHEVAPPSTQVAPTIPALVPKRPATHTLPMGQEPAPVESLGHAPTVREPSVADTVVDPGLEGHARPGAAPLAPLAADAPTDLADVAITPAKSAASGRRAESATAKSEWATPGKTRSAPAVSMVSVRAPAALGLESPASAPAPPGESPASPVLAAPDPAETAAPASDQPPARATAPASRRALVVGAAAALLVGGLALAAARPTRTTTPESTTPAAAPTGSPPATSAHVELQAPSAAPSASAVAQPSGAGPAGSGSASAARLDRAPPRRAPTPPDASAGPRAGEPAGPKSPDIRPPPAPIHL